MSEGQSPINSPGRACSTYSTKYSSSSSSTNKTLTRGGKPETVSESVESSSSSSSGDSAPPSFGKFHDNFEELKRSILSGDAYKRTQRLHKDTLPQQGQQHYKPQEGITTIRPLRAERLSSTGSTGSLGSSTSGQDPLSPNSSTSDYGNQPIYTNGTSRSRNVSRPVSSTARMDDNNFKTELYIPVRRHHGDFDDFFKNRWLEQNTSNTHVDSEFNRRRTDWESKLDDMKRDFFHFSPFGEQHHHPYIESSNTIQPAHVANSYSGPTGNPEFAVRFNVKDFKPEEINVSTKAGKLTISATHEEKSGNSTSRREFKRTVDIPSDVQIGLMRSTLSKDGILSITAPIKPPNYLPGASSGSSPITATSVPGLQSSSLVTQQHANAVSTRPGSSTVVTRQADTGDALNFSLSIAGYQPQEVTVTVEGRKVIVHAKHDEAGSGRKVHNEMTKSFDLPPTVDPHHVRSYIKDGSTLFIEAQLRDDLAGKIHLVPVTHKY